MLSIVSSQPVKHAMRAVILIVAVPTVLAAQGLDWRQRGDRFEGVVRGRDISGAYFSLIGIYLEGEGDLQADADRLTVVFRLPSARTVNVKVWEPVTNYWMVPVKKKYDGGRQMFTWPAAAVINPLDLDVRKLRVLVTDPTETTVYPAALVSRIATGGSKGYRFVFESKGAIELAGRIVKESDGRSQILSRFKLVEDFPGVIQMRWNGLDPAGNPVDAGVLRLLIEGDIYLRDSEEYVTTDIRFQHHD